MSTTNLDTGLNHKKVFQRVIRKESLPSGLSIELGKPLHQHYAGIRDAQLYFLKNSVFQIPLETPDLPFEGSTVRSPCGIASVHCHGHSVFLFEVKLRNKNWFTKRNEYCMYDIRVIQ
jgi:hypothetical protein